MFMGTSQKSPRFRSGLLSELVAPTHPAHNAPEQGECTGTNPEITPHSKDHVQAPKSCNILVTCYGSWTKYFCGQGKVRVQNELTVG